MIEWAEHLFAVFVMGNTAFIVGFSIVIFIYYSKIEHRHLAHIALMAGSFILLVFLVVGASNFRIFYTGISRDISNAALFIAMVMADIALLKLWRRRQGKRVNE